MGTVIDEDDLLTDLLNHFGSNLNACVLAVNARKGNDPQLDQIGADGFIRHLDQVDRVSKKWFFSVANAEPVETTSSNSLELSNQPFDIFCMVFFYREGNKAWNTKGMRYRVAVRECLKTFDTEYLGKGQIEMIRLINEPFDIPEVKATGLIGSGVQIRVTLA